MPQTRATCSIARITSRRPRPWPPYATGMVMPMSPASTSCLMFSQGYSSRSSQRAARSRNSCSASARARAWMASCSAVSGKRMVSPARRRRAW